MKYSATPNHWNVHDRPREKAVRSGISSLSDTELLALLLGSGNRSASVYQLADSARPILEDCRNSPETAMSRLTELKGLGSVKSMLLSAALEFGKRSFGRNRTRVDCPEDIYQFLRFYGERKQEHFIAVCLDGAHQVIDFSVVTMGLLNRSLVHPREVFASAIETRSAAIIVAHNHPSGNLDPSPEDKEVTRRLSEAGELLGIPLLDHIVFSSEDWVSFREMGLLS